MKLSARVLSYIPVQDKSPPSGDLLSGVVLETTVKGFGVGVNLPVNKVRVKHPNNDA